LVSVVFADLVGFTTASEGRDAEDTRELLSRYFETCQRLVALYGGTVEKFIGDAVMAVWGAPVANEDDAERAVRAALDLVAAVPTLDPGLAARAGVLTGEAAVTMGATGQGMVAGDLVNTASRIQSVAEPGSVLVGEATRRATEAAIAYEPAGEQELKGKAEPVPVHRALRVIANVGGRQRSSGLEPPFVGRERELRLVKELFHASAEEKKAHLVSVIGIAGIGKSRLSWEFEKYIDGLADTMWWWRGRCLAYGEGVAYWALAEMVRIRADIVEGEDPASARAKLTNALVDYISDAEERAWIEPRLAHLLGLEERATHERDDLFAAWRLYFERLSEHQPAVLIFEDMQWADASLLEFVEFLLEWSRNHPIFVLALARPELAERHADFGKSTRTATTISLEPLGPTAMEALLDGCVPGLPDQLRAQILARSEGVPLYTVETVRMLLDRGLLERRGEAYAPTGAIEALDVPETLHALVAARLDGLSQEERRIVQDGSILGKTFTKASLADLSGIPEPELDPLLSSLVRKEVLTMQADPRSPERGQYGFLQDLLKRVAYETLSKRERKTRHLAAVGYLERSRGPAEEIVEIVASHYVAAYGAAPDADDSAEIKQRAREHLTRAAERAASLAANEEAQRYFEQAAELAEEPLVRARLLERAGETAWASARAEEARAHYELAIALFEQEGETHPAARVSARLGEVDWMTGRLDEALGRMERAYDVLSQEDPDEDFAALAAMLGRLYFFKGELDLAKERLETALAIAEAHRLSGLLADVLISEGNVALPQGRPEKALALFRHALEIALEHDVPAPALRAYYNLANLLRGRDRYEEALDHLEKGLLLARKVGNRQWEQLALAGSAYCLALVSRLDDARTRTAEVPESERSGSIAFAVLSALTMMEVAQGDPVETRALLALAAGSQKSADLQDQASYAAAKASVLRADGAYTEALAAAEQALGAMSVLGAANEDVKTAFVEAFEAALALGDLDRAAGVVERIEALRPGEQPPYLRAHAARFRSRLAAVRGEHDIVEQGFKTGEQIFREYGIPFWLAVTQLEHGEWLSGQGRGEEAQPLLAEAREILERLEATPWLDRLDAIRAARGAEILA
jgi:class 3 adenylate cyclase/tetratricopeptide (TPR) repeat protein